MHPINTVSLQPLRSLSFHLHPYLSLSLVLQSGMKVVVVNSDENGNVDLEDLKAKALKHKDNLAALMITYPRYTFNFSYIRINSTQHHIIITTSLFNL